MWLFMAASLDSVFKKKRDEDQPKNRLQYSKKIHDHEKIRTRDPGIRLPGLGKRMRQHDAFRGGEGVISKKAFGFVKRIAIGYYTISLMAAG